MKSFKEFMSEGPLTSIMKQHTDPMSFTLAAIKAQRAKNIKITRNRGAASTRELAAAFRRYKKRQNQNARSK
jgi:hypothetical protein|tara:strand:+ start:1518 stop:1733 length:216 start_codon:yes stop_codon:yes gene_type:complete